MSDVPAGWHQDPSNPNQERWWDGTQWSPNQVRPKPLAGPASNQFPQQPPGARAHILHQPINNLDLLLTSKPSLMEQPLNKAAMALFC